MTSAFLSPLVSPLTSPLISRLQLNGTNFIRGSDYVCDFWHHDDAHGTPQHRCRQNQPWTHEAADCSAAASHAHAALLHAGHNTTDAERSWGHVPPYEDADIADWPTCCSAVRSGSCIGRQSTCTAASFVSNSEVRCATPLVSHPTFMRVRLSLNGQQVIMPPGPSNTALFTPRIQTNTPRSRARQTRNPGQNPLPPPRSHRARR